MEAEGPWPLSVVVVTHDSADSLRRSLPAIVAELRAGDELIVSDNGSTDATHAVVAELAPEAELLANPANPGFGAACNRGAERAGGRLLLFLNPDNVVLEQNSPVVNTGDRLILFDTGMGTSKAFGPTTGRQQKSLMEAGIKPGDIDAIVLSHAHIDHIGGIVGADDKPLFPNAQYYIAQSDFDFWTDEGKLGSPLKDFVVHARKNLMPVRDRIVFFKDNQEFLPGVTALAAPGHTVGHTIFMVNSAGKSFCFLGDLSHHAVLLLEKPRMEFSYDTDPKLAASSRVRLLEMLAAQKIPVMSYHFAWPGYGHVAKAGDGFHYYPEPMNMQL